MSYKKTLQAIYATIDNRTIYHLHPNTTDIFQWLPGWELPSGAPANLSK